VLVSSTDGVGTKALVAQATGRFTTIGIDLVAMCVDDLVCQGAEPLFFLDYIAVGRLDPDHIEQLVEGVAEGCRQAGCALIGGEMAEHPGAMEPGEFDLVGFAVGIAERDGLVTGAHIQPGDALVGLPSPNLRSNGYSLARRVLLERAGRSLDAAAYDGAHHSLADELLAPSVIYAPAVTALQRAVDVRGVAHITGGGVPGNLSRVLPKGTAARLERRSWEVPRIFTEIQDLGGVARRGGPRGDGPGVQHGPRHDRGGARGRCVQGPRRAAHQRPPRRGGRPGRRRRRLRHHRLTGLAGLVGASGSVGGR
jgi:phosphoribosylformylglycinamidine cyclo-ligase